MPGRLEGRIALVTGGNSGIGHAAAFLASDHSSDMTGSELFVDGGMSQV